MAKTTVVICIDGLDPAYLDACDAPNIRELGRKGFFKVGRCMMPSVTNVNNVSLVTASYPEVHGISSNYRKIRETGQEIYMESGEYVLAETMFQRARRQGKSSILVTAKDKLRRQLGHKLKGICFSSELADRATLETDRSLELRTRDRERKLISKIDTALRRIEEGTYGFCEATHAPISLRRLEARPIATLSIEAQERHERAERTHRDN